MKEIYLCSVDDIYLHDDRLTSEIYHKLNRLINYLKLAAFQLQRDLLLAIVDVLMLETKSYKIKC